MFVGEAVARMQLALASAGQRLGQALPQRLQGPHVALDRVQTALTVAARRGLQAQTHRLQSLELRLGLLDPHLVLARGFAWLTDDQGHALTHAAQLEAGQRIEATLADGRAALRVESVIRN
jgi:exodeoxyribonuclease VII large subunit